jgi:TonB family protein
VPTPAPPEPKPPPLNAERLPPLLVPIVSAPADMRDRAGALEQTATQTDSHGPGAGGGAGTGKGTGVGEGDGAGIGPGSGGGTGGGPFRPGSGIEPPRLLREVKADYTEEARQRNIVGDVVLEIVVRRDGSVGDIKVMRGLGAGLNERAVQAVANGASPAQRLGAPVDVIVEVSVEFSSVKAPMHITLIVITVVSLTLAAIMSVVTWRLTARGATPIGSARVAALATEIHGEAGTIRRFDDELELRQAPILAAAAIFLRRPIRRVSGLAVRRRGRARYFRRGHRCGACRRVEQRLAAVRQIPRRHGRPSRRPRIRSCAPRRRRRLHRSNLSRSSSWRSVTSGMPIGSPFAVWSGTRRRAPEKAASRRSSSCSTTMAGYSPADARRSTSRRSRRARNHPSS